MIYGKKKGSGGNAQSLEPRKARLEGGAERGREWGTAMEDKGYHATVAKDRGGEKWRRMGAEKHRNESPGRGFIK